MLRTRQACGYHAGSSGADPAQALPRAGDRGEHSDVTFQGTKLQVLCLSESEPAFLGSLGIAGPETMGVKP